MERLSEEASAKIAEDIRLMNQHDDGPVPTHYCAAVGFSALDDIIKAYQLKAARTKTKLDQLLDDLGTSKLLDCRARVVTAPVKSYTSTKRKVLGELSGHVRLLDDLVRASVIAPALADPRPIIMAIRQCAEKNCLQIVRECDHIGEKGYGSGFQFYCINLWDPAEEIIAEIQLKPHWVETLGAIIGHYLYEQVRQLDSKLEDRTCSRLWSFTMDLVQTELYCSGTEKNQDGILSEASLFQIFNDTRDRLQTIGNKALLNAEKTGVQILNAGEIVRDVEARIEAGIKSNFTVPENCASMGARFVQLD